MKAVRIARHGIPREAVDCVEAEDPPAPQGDEILVKVLACPINPADILILEGRYPGPDLPSGGGIEGFGEVLDAGPEVKGLSPGDRVMLLGRENWAQKVLCPETGAIKAPADLDPLQGAMMKANPASAFLMLQDYVELSPGDWVIQNAANSAVGRHLIQLAKMMGCKTVNVVRRQSLIAELESEGADLVLVDGDDLGTRVREAIGAEAPLPLAIDAIGGKACERLADCLSDGGTVVNYGFLSGDPCMITPHQTVIHDIRLRGFWLAGFFRRGETAYLREVYGKIADYMKEGVLRAPVEATYPIEEIQDAVAHAVREGRDGKILVLPNGSLD